MPLRIRDLSVVASNMVYPDGSSREEYLDSIRFRLRNDDIYNSGSPNLSDGVSAAERQLVALDNQANVRRIMQERQANGLSFLPFGIVNIQYLAQVELRLDAKLAAKRRQQSS